MAVRFTPAERAAKVGRPLCTWCAQYPVSVHAVTGRHSYYCSTRCRSAADQHRARERDNKERLECSMKCGRLRYSAHANCLYCRECRRKLQDQSKVEALTVRAKREEASPKVLPVAPPQPPARERSLPVLRSLTPGVTPRPVYVLDSNGWTVNLAVHDVFYQEHMEALKRLRVASHPDKGGTHAKFLKAQRRIEEFEKVEKAWYSQWGLEAPRT